MSKSLILGTILQINDSQLTNEHGELIAAEGDFSISQPEYKQFLISLHKEREETIMQQ